MGRIAGALIAALALLAWAAPASAGPQQRTAVYEHSPQVSLGTTGDALVAWQRNGARRSAVLADSGAPGEISTVDVSGRLVTGPGGHRAIVDHDTEVIRITRLDDAGLVESTETITSPGLSDVKAAFDAAGRMTVTWKIAPVVGDAAVYAVRTDAQGRPGPAREVFPDRSTLDWSLATGSQGRTVVARLATGSMDIVALDPDGVPGPMTQVANYQAGPPTVAVDSQDRPTIAWTELRPGGSNDPYFVRMRRVESDGTLGPIQTLAEGEHVGLLGLDFDAAGGGTVLLRLPSPAFGGGSIGAVRIAPDGTPGPVRAVAPPTFVLRWGLDDLGRTRIAWEKEGRIETRLLQANGSPGGVRTIIEMTGSPTLGPSYLDMDTDGQGRATIAWARWPRFPTASYGPVEAIRITADGSFGQVHQVSRGDRSPPELIVDRVRTQRLSASVDLTAACDEGCRLSADGHVDVLHRRGGRWRPKARIALIAVTDADNICRPSGHACPKKLDLGLAVDDFSRARRFLRRGRKLVAAVDVRAEDGAGNTDAETQRIRLKPLAPRTR